MLRFEFWAFLLSQSLCLQSETMAPRKSHFRNYFCDGMDKLLQLSLSLSPSLHPSCREANCLHDSSAKSGTPNRSGKSLILLSQSHCFQSETVPHKVFVLNSVISSVMVWICSSSCLFLSCREVNCLHNSSFNESTSSTFLTLASMST